MTNIYQGSLYLLTSIEERNIESLSNILYLPDVLFRSNKKYLKSVDLIEGYPYLESGELDKNYVKKILDKAIDIYNSLSLSDDLYLIYENIYGEDDSLELEFLESCIENIDGSDVFSFTWEDEEEVQTARRYIYRISGFDREKLFKEIVKSDIGRNFKYTSSIYLLDKTCGNMFSLYDDRGINIYNFNIYSK